MGRTVRWHLMYVVTDPRDCFDRMVNEDVRCRVISAHAILAAADYAQWKESGGLGQVSGRLLSDHEGWSPPALLDGWSLASAHRRSSRLPRPGQGDPEEWPDFRIWDVDRFLGRYNSLEAASVRFFETRLRHDRATEQVLEAIDALESCRAVDETTALIASQAAMFHRAGEVVGSWRGRPIDDPRRLPGPLTDDVLNVLRGWRTGRGVKAHCEYPEEAAAAALLHVLSARWRQGKEAPGWAWDRLEEGDCAPGDVEDELGEVRRIWALPQGSAWWLD
jgi:hypothetical protein